VLIGALKLDPKLGAAATPVLRSAIEEVLGAANTAIAEAKKVAQHRAVLNIPAGEAPKQGCALAQSVSATDYLTASFNLDVAGKNVTISVALHLTKDCSSRASSKTVPRSEMITALKEIVKTQVSRR